MDALPAQTTGQSPLKPTAEPSLRKKRYLNKNSYAFYIIDSITTLD
jgi:hypothetical protein